MTGAAPVGREVVSAAAMQAGLDRLAAAIQPVVDSDECVLLGVMHGGMYPLMELARRLQGDFLLDYCHATRYRGGTTGKEIIWERAPSAEIAGRHVLVVDDILDVGATLEAVLAACRRQGAATVSSVVQVVKDTALRPAERQADFSTGITVPDAYVYGCGMDVAGHWRHLPAIYEWPEGRALPGIATP